MPGELLCDACRDSLPWIEQRWACPACGAPHGWLTCTGCGADAVHASVVGGMEASAWECRAVVCALEFVGPAALMATTLKDAHELRLASVLAAAMATALDEASSWPALDGEARFDRAAVDAICFVPATPAAYNRRGFDHMELVAHALANLLDLPLADVLIRCASKDQRNLGKQSRAENLRGTVRVIDDVSDARLLLVDDVITTGASVREATRSLLSRGARSATACCLARVW